MTSFRIWLTALLLTAFTVLPVEANAVSKTSDIQSGPVKEYQLKAVFLFNFAQFVDWPAEAFTNSQSSLNICILGDDPFGKYLDETVRGERVNNRPLAIQRYHKLEDIKACHILFVSRSESKKLDQIVTGLNAKNILTVSDMDKFASHGGMIRFLTENNKIRLRINLESIKSAGLTISSKLLRPADIVNSNTSGTD